MIKEKIEIGGKVLLVSPLKAQEIRKRMIARLKKDSEITEELRRERMLPSGHCNQTSKLTGSNYHSNNVIDRRAINHVVYGMTAVLETRFLDHLRREWSV
jgi:hypothetical protein